MLRIKPCLRLLILLLCALSAGGILFCCKSSKDTIAPVPVIFSTDLFHPHGDMDDQVDLAVLYGLEGIDLKLVILDHGKGQLRRPGTIPVRQMNYITDRNVAAEIGLSENLINLEDKALDRPEQFQKAISAILDVMRSSSEKVVIITVGSLRDIAAAYNREPELFHEKLGRLFIFAGDASKKDFVETNVKMDTIAFSRIMNTNLPIFWVPCFDGGLWQNRGRASYWQTTYGAILKDVAPSVLKYFIYAAKRDVKQDPIAAISGPIDDAYRSRFFRGARNLWGSSVFFAAAGKALEYNNNGYAVVNEKKAQKDRVAFDFFPVHISASPGGIVSYVERGAGNGVLQFRVLNMENYSTVMTAATNDLLKSISFEDDR